MIETLNWLYVAWSVAGFLFLTFIIILIMYIQEKSQKLTLLRDMYIVSDSGNLTKKRVHFAIKRPKITKKVPEKKNVLRKKVHAKPKKRKKTSVVKKTSPKKKVRHTKKKK